MNEHTLKEKVSPCKDGITHFTPVVFKVHLDPMQSWRFDFKKQFIPISDEIKLLEIQYVKEQR